MEEAKVVFEALDRSGIAYRLVEHEAAYTVEDMDRFGLKAYGEIPKNLFLRDAAGKKHFLVVLRGDKTADLRALRAQLGTSALSFASEERLSKYLGLVKGAVTPFGVLNDEDRLITVVFDRDLTGLPSVGFHPNRNTATVFLPFADALRVVEGHGNAVLYATI